MNKPVVLRSRRIKPPPVKCDDNTVKTMTATRKVSSRLLAAASRTVNNNNNNVNKSKSNNKDNDSGSKSSVKQPQQEKLNNSTSIISSRRRNLRRRKSGKTYRESSLIETPPPVLVKTTTHLPIYKQQIIVPEEKKNDDLYDFDSDTECVKKTARKRKPRQNHCKNNKSSMGQYDKKMQKILKRGKKKVVFEPIVRLERLNIDDLLLVKKTTSNIHNDDEVSSDEFFGFDNEIIDDKNDKIQILNDVLLTPKTITNNNIIDNTSVIVFDKPNANSTMLLNNLITLSSKNNDRLLTPWRFNSVNMKRNPHFLSLKKTALPNISQDMILDHTFDDSCNKTPLPRNHQKRNISNNKKKLSPKQKNLLNYISISNVNTTIIPDQENVNFTNNNNTSTLFNDNEFSPLKNNHRSTIKSTLNVKRNVFSPIVDNVVNTTGRNKSSNILLIEDDNNKKNNDKKTDINDDDNNVTLYGFDTIDNESNDLVTKASDNDINNKPFRLENIVRKYENRKSHKNRKDEASDGENNDEEEDDDDFINNPADGSNHSAVNENNVVGIFQDLEINNSIKPHTRKRKIKWLLSDEERIKKKQQKNVLTKEEEEAFNKWADAFNQMCEEVDKCPLEIE